MQATLEKSDKAAAASGYINPAPDNVYPSAVTAASTGMSSAYATKKDWGKVEADLKVTRSSKLATYHHWQLLGVQLLQHCTQLWWG